MDLASSVQFTTESFRISRISIISNDFQGDDWEASPPSWALWRDQIITGTTPMRTMMIIIMTIVVMMTTRILHNDDNDTTTAMTVVMMTIAVHDMI